MKCARWKIEQETSPTHYDAELRELGMSFGRRMCRSKGLGQKSSEAITTQPPRVEFLD